MMVWVIAYQTHNLVLRKTLIRDLLGEHLPDYHSKAVHVCLLIHLMFIADDLRSHPLIGPHSLVLLLLLLLTSQSKITQFYHIPLIPNEHIGTLEISVQYLFHIVKVNHALHSFIDDLYLL